MASDESTPAPPKLFIDVGVNLTDPVFRGVHKHGQRAHEDDLHLVVHRARSVGVHQMIITGGSLHESREAVRMAKELGLTCTVGCHPTRASEFVQKAASPEAYLQSLRDLAVSNAEVVVAIGECGLDYDRLFFCDADTQRRFFPLQINLAMDLGLPLFLHDRNSGGDFLSILKDARARGAAGSKPFPGGVVHSFTGTEGELQAYVELGLYISVNGCSLKTPENLDVVKKIPLDRLLIETDAPWCDIRNTHASAALLAAAYPLPPAVGGGGKKGTGSPSESALWRELGIEVGMNAVHRPGAPVDPGKFAMGRMVKGRNEPCAIAKVFSVLYQLRRGEVATASQLAQLILDNTRRLFFSRQR